MLGPRAAGKSGRGRPERARGGARRQALPVAASENKIYGLEALELETAKTKSFLEILGKLPLEKNLRRVLIVTSGETKNLEMASRNIQAVKLLDSTKLNVPDILGAHAIVFVGRAMDDLQEVLTK